MHTTLAGVQTLPLLPYWRGWGGIWDSRAHWVVGVHSPGMWAAGSPAKAPVCDRPSMIPFLPACCSVPLLP